MGVEMQLEDHVKRIVLLPLIWCEKHLIFVPGTDFRVEAAVINGTPLPRYPKFRIAKSMC